MEKEISFSKVIVPMSMGEYVRLEGIFQRDVSVHVSTTWEKKDGFRYDGMPFGVNHAPFSLPHDLVDRDEMIFGIKEDCLRPNDWVALHKKNNSGGYARSSTGTIKVVAHKLSLLNPPSEGWKVVAGVDWHYKSYEGDHLGEWTTLKLKTLSGKPKGHEEVFKELGLRKIYHPYGWLWLDGNRPVAVSLPWKKVSYPDCKSETRLISGELEWFSYKKLALVSETKKN